jgi:hypothetical protein
VERPLCTERRSRCIPYYLTNLRCVSPQLTLNLSNQMQMLMHRTSCSLFTAAAVRQACDSHVCCVSQVITSMNRLQMHQLYKFWQAQSPVESLDRILTRNHRQLDGGLFARLRDCVMLLPLTNVMCWEQSLQGAMRTSQRHLCMV